MLADMRRTRVIYALLAALAFGGCGECQRHVDCALRHDLRSCAGGPDCIASYRCERGRNGGRCENGCTPLGGACGLQAGMREDGCRFYVRPGEEPTCVSTNGDKDRCRAATDEKGRPTCIDAKPPCGGCAMAFGTCTAKSHCYGTICLF
jgi:hypothetical protein